MLAIKDEVVKHLAALIEDQKDGTKSLTLFLRMRELRTIYAYGHQNILRERWRVLSKEIPSN